MRRPAHSPLVHKSRSACIAAIESYNRVAAPYREENFAILMINAWELLLKARIMQENGGKTSHIYEKQNKRKKDGTPSKVQITKLARSGLPCTIGIEKAWNIVSNYRQNKIDQVCITNLEALLEIRDSATHFIFTQKQEIGRVLAEIALASVRNYVTAAQKWFGLSFADLNIASIPISFDLDRKDLVAGAKKAPSEVVRFLAYLNGTRGGSAPASSEFAYRVQIDFDLVKKKVDGAVTATVVSSKDNPDITVAYAGDQVPNGFDWDYATLTRKMSERFSDFKANSKYHAHRKPLEKNAKFCFERYLDPKKKSSSPKRYYSPNIISRFDAHYTRKP